MITSENATRVLFIDPNVIKLVIRLKNFTIIKSVASHTRKIKEVKHESRR